MISIVKHRVWFYVISGILITASIASLVFWGLRPGIDFEGGTYWEFQFSKPLDKTVVEQALQKAVTGDVIVQQSGDLFTVRTKELTEQDHQTLIGVAKNIDPSFSELQWQTVGPTVGDTLRQKSIEAIIFVIIGISLYVAFAFRHASRPISSWKYGLITVATLFHDVSIPLGFFAIIGHFLHIEIDTNFIVAMLVIMGFSVHDTIVVFDRIREKLRVLRVATPFPDIVNQSLNETLTRSINTSFTVLLALVAVYIWGSYTLKWFILTLMVGIFTGTYSSIFIGSTLLVDVWRLQERARMRK